MISALTKILSIANIGSISGPTQPSYVAKSSSFSAIERFYYPL